MVGSGLRLTLAGLVLGCAAAAGLTRLLESQLYGVRATDLPTFVTVGASLLLVAAGACYLPARLASRVDPAEALRQD